LIDNGQICPLAGAKVAATSLPTGPNRVGIPQSSDRGFQMVAQLLQSSQF